MSKLRILIVLFLIFDSHSQSQDETHCYDHDCSEIDDNFLPQDGNNDESCSR